MKNLFLAGLLLATASTYTASADQLIYAYNDTGEHRIHIKDMDTGADRIVTPAGGAAWNATFSPDGKSFVYTWQKDGTSHVFIAPVSGGEHTQLTHGELTAYHPSFSPDGSKIVFTNSTMSGVMMMNRDGSNAQLFAESEARETHPVFFQDGKRILFVSRRSASELNQPGIYIYNAETGETTHTGFFGSYARPSHDGKLIVFSGKRDADADIDLFIAELGSDAAPVALTKGGGYDGHPAFTEDDRKIVFVSGRAQSVPLRDDQDPNTEGTNEVFLMNIDGSDVKRLTHGNVVSWHPEIKR